MTLVVHEADGRLVIEDSDHLITGRHVHQLSYWGFASDDLLLRFVARPRDTHATLDKILAYFEQHDIPYSMTPVAEMGRALAEQHRADLSGALVKGARFKAGEFEAEERNAFLSHVRTHVRRELKDHQTKAALHLLAVSNGANFSVPGSGKTAVVLAVFSWLRSKGIVDALYVVGPPSCFGPWQTEYQAVLGQEPSAELLAGGDAEERRARYDAVLISMPDLLLTTFQTLQRDQEHVQRLFTDDRARFFLVVDEAHYIKQLGGAWASAVLTIAGHAVRRCVLTGTPFPRSYSDSFNLFDVLWPRSAPLPASTRLELEVLSERRRDDEASGLLAKSIGPLFYRVRKRDLGLAEQRFHDPLVVQMRTHEKRLYDAIVDRVRDVSMEDYLRDIDLLAKLRRGRMMRLRQAVSYPKLLGTAVVEYDENLTSSELGVADLIRHYDELETPGKIAALCQLVSELREAGETKVVVWSNFIGTLKLIKHHLEAHGYGVGMIYGDTPTEATALGTEATRETIIAKFVDSQSSLNVLIANPAACAESISLHKTCSSAVYYDLSYNCAQYLQSLDRIHRVGGSEERQANYYVLQYPDTIDQDVLENLHAKAERMSSIVDSDYPIYSLDMFAADEEAEAYERLFHGSRADR